MRTVQHKTGIASVWSLLLVACLAACGSDSSDGKTVAVNLSLIVDGRQTQDRPAVSRLLAWLDRWLPGGTPAWAQSVSDIASIQVQISGPGIPVPATATVPVSDPTSGQEIPVSIQAPVGPDRTITVAAFNAASPPLKIFGGTLPGVSLAAGAPVNLEITLVRLFTVTVQKVGSGSGTVTSSPAGIDCGEICGIQFPDGTNVSLTASAAPGSFFAGWSGACSSNGACNVSSNATVTARFTAATNTGRLTVTKNGNGSGVVTSNPSGISCGAACSAEFTTPTTVVFLEATPSGGSTFSGWSGAGCSGTGACVVVMVSDQNVTATFTAPVSLPTLTVTKLGAGEGTVSSDPPGITGCTGTCSANFASGRRVNLTATPSSGARFAGWGGACEGDGRCSVDMDGNRSVTATFDPPVSLSLLTVQKGGTGSGRVTSSPNGIDCGTGCSAPLATGSGVTLTANPDPGSVFIGWSGGGCSGNAPCSTVMSGDQTVFAQFDLAPTS
jgi:List-Bact-rpt repeat protein